MALGKKNRGFTIGRERASPLLFPYHVAIQANLKDAPTTANEYSLSSRRILYLRRHTVSFWPVVSLLAVFNLDFHTFTLKERSLMDRRGRCAGFIIRVVGHADGLNHIDDILRWRWRK